MNSIDRKLARVAREIELANPARMSFLDFEQISHDYVLGSTDEPKKQEPQPPSVQKFRVGDRVRWTEKVMRDNHFTPDMNEPWVISRLDGSKAYDSAGQYDDIECLEMDISPASETETEGWQDFGPDTPNLPPDQYEYRSRSANDLRAAHKPKFLPLNANFTSASQRAAYQWRKVKP